MRDCLSYNTVHMYSINGYIPLSSESASLLLPYIEERIPAGFPSPADDFSIRTHDLNAILVPRPLTTFLWRVGGKSMQEAGIFDGDVLVVDRSLRAEHGDVVVAQVDNEFTVKYLHRRHGAVRLVPANPTFPDIVPRDGQEILIVGVVTASIKQFRKFGSR